MQKHLITLTLFFMLGMIGMNAENVHDTNDEKGTNEASEFVSDEKLEPGFITEVINNSIEKAFDQASANTEKKYGRTITDYASAPKFGGYFVGKYSYSSQNGKNNGDGFSQRYTRLYVDGTILGDFAYRIQMQCNNSSFHMKDYFVEYRHFKEFMVKFGQFKRAFTFENPMNPWDVGFGDYSQLVKKLAGMGDYCGEAAVVGGRDQGLQVQGDLFPVSKDQHRLLHYQLAVYNGQGINVADANKTKDFIGTIQIQPVKNLMIGFFGWTGNYVQDGITVDRNRYGISAKYDRNAWSARAEYVHSQGYKVSDVKENKADATGRADAWYATIGIPCTPWLKTWVKYDVYRDQATWNSAKSMYCVAPSFQLHKNLMFQLEYHYVNDRMLKAHRNYNELWLETYVRF